MSRKVCKTYCGIDFAFNTLGNFVCQGRSGGQPALMISKNEIFLMAALARVLFRASEIEVLKHVVMFCGASLFVALLLATYGLDLSPGFF
jgi:hypothetical protein